MSAARNAGGTAQAEPRAASRRAAAALASRVRARARRLLVVRRVGVIAAWTLAGVLLAVLADRVFRLPVGPRVGVLVIAVTALAWAAVRYLRPALRFSPSLTEVALRIEKSRGGEKLRGLLAASLELGDSAATSDDPRVQRLIEDAERELAQTDDGEIYQTAPSRRAVAGAGAIAAVFAVAVIVAPTLATIGLPRVLWPWSDAAWPKRTLVVDTTPGGVRAIGAAVPIRAALVRTNTDADRTPVDVSYRVIVDGQPGPERRVRLTSQQRDVMLDADELADQTSDASPPAHELSGRLYERLLEPVVPDGPDGRAAMEAELEYRLITLDDETAPARVLLVEPPAVVSAEARLTPPAYAATRLGESGLFAGPIELGRGLDERAAPGAALAGSRVRLAIELNKPVPGPPDDDALRTWTAAALGDDAAALLSDGAELAVDGTTWTIEWTLRETTVVRISAVDTHGVESVEPSAFAFDVLRDRPPQAAITEPREDLAVLPTAIIEIAGEGRDDVGLAWTGLERVLARAPQDSEGAPAEPVAPPQTFVTVNAPVDAVSLRLESASNLDLSELELSPGDELWLTALAKDIYALDGEEHEPARSRVRKIRIISQERFVEQVWGELGSVRRAAIRLDEAQQQARRDAERPLNAERTRVDQAQITEQLRRLSESIDDVRDRMRDNRFEDASLDAIAQEARRQLDRAGAASAEAAGGLEQLARAEQAGEQGNPEDRERTTDAQDDVRDRLGELVEALDRGEDAWAVRRALERLAREQRELMERTAEAGRETAGKSAEQLSAQQQSELADIASAQQRLSEQASDALDELLEREAALRESEPAEAQALAEAARRGQRAQVPQKLEQASQSVQQNQTGNAMEQQQQALEALEEMLEDLEAGERNRDRVLRRQLADLMESIQGLVQTQEAELETLTALVETNGQAGARAGPMATLHMRTLGVLDQAQSSARQAAPVADLVGEAADAQARAVVALRATPPDGGAALVHEQRSLDKLLAALEEARKIDEDAAQREQDRQRDELRAAYTEALKEQIRVSQETEPLVGAEATRRTRFAARRIGADQTTLRDRVNELAGLNDLDDTIVFRFAHERLDREMGRAAQQLTDGTPTAATARAQDSAARTLRSLVQALEDAKQDDKDFRENESGNQGGQSGGQQGGQGEQPLVPPIAELRVLRALQEEARDLTRLTDDLRRSDPAESELVGRDAASLQRQILQHAERLAEELREQQGQGKPAGVEPDKLDQPPVREGTF